MRVERFFAALVIAAGVTAGCESTQTAETDHAALAEQGPITESTATLTVHGMGCPLCANNVDKQLLAVPGVREVNVDLGSGTVTVHLEGENRPTAADLAKAIDDSGFTLVSINTP